MASIMTLAEREAFIVWLSESVPDYEGIPGEIMQLLQDAFVAGINYEPPRASQEDILTHNMNPLRHL